MRRSCRLPGGYSGIHLAPSLAHHDKTTRGRAAREASEWVRLTKGIDWSWGGPDRTGFRPGDCQVGSKVGMGVFALFLARYLVVVGPWIRVLALDWSRVCFFRSVRCHGHVGACVAARRHVAWCGPTGFTWCLVHISLIRALMYANHISVLIILSSPS
jgi:hypothetical protein